MGLLSQFHTLEGRQKVFTFIVLRVRWISTLLFLGGIAWLLVLPDERFNIPTRISENALLPGQVQTHFGGSDYKVLNAFRNEIRIWEQAEGDEERLAGIESIFRNTGMRSARQRYNVSLGTRKYSGTNVYGLLEAPRGDATEALVLNAAWKNRDGVVNEGGINQLLALARYFRRWSLWSKDILFVVPADRDFGSQAWIDAYHENHNVDSVESLTLTSGVIHAGVDIDWYGPENRYNDINIKYEGSNGQLANLDLVNSAIHIAKHQLGIMPYIQQTRTDDYASRIMIMLKALANQAHGLPTGSHSPFIPYKIDIISIEVEGVQDGHHDDSSLGRVFESIFRTLNNILEHLHASFFFYILINTHRFVSIGTYLPSAMLIALCYTLNGLSSYLKSTNKIQLASQTASQIELKPTIPDDTANVAQLISKDHRTFSLSRCLRPAGIVAAAHTLGILLFLALRIVAHSQSTFLFTSFLVLEYCVSIIGSTLFSRHLHYDDVILISSFSQIVLGMFLSAIATVNFPLSLFIGIIAFPITFMGPTQHKIVQILIRVTLLVFTSPMSILYLFCVLTGMDWKELIMHITFGYEWLHVWTPLAIFGVWWPAYFLTSVAL